MVFSSAVFLFYFFPCFLLLYYVLPWKNAVLLLGSLLFYAWGEPRYVPLLMASALLNYGFGYLVFRVDAYRKALLVLGIVLNLGMLAYYKYAGFFVDTLAALHVYQAPPNSILHSIILPLGISFFTFQGISYLIDVYRRDIAAQSSFLRFAMYKSMFPQLIAGPIVRYSQIAGEIEHRMISNVRIWFGLRQFVLGLAQKVLIANTVALPADRIFAVDPAQLDAPAAWIGLACYSIQILFDFAGYSNMAIGIGHMLGFTYPPNFKRPYSALSITDFWRRWHISLSTWFRDYLYIPLGGNRSSKLRTYFNLGLVFLLCGLWHGAAWTFVVWGIWHGLLLIVERLGMGAVLQRCPWPLAQAYTLLCVMIGWVFFRADNIPHALAYLHGMFGGHQAGTALHSWQMDIGWSGGVALVVGFLIATWRLRGKARIATNDTVDSAMLATAQTGGVRILAGTAGALATVALFLLCVASLAAGTYNPFIYFRF